MGDRADTNAVTIRTAVPADAEAITRTYIESSEHHAGLDPGRYWIPDADSIVARYREGRQHSPEEPGITLVAELNGEVVGFVDVRLDRSQDPMHRDLLYCHIAEIAVSRRAQSQGVGEKLLRSAEEWGRENGAQLSRLEYLASNTRAASFYHERMGYDVVAMMAVKKL
jgi:ribosomal protein S18 acetylase RimI-like enzyme